jgi:hypothetical protein
LFLLLCPLPSFAQSSSPLNPRHQFALARSHYEHDNKNVQAAWQFGRACFDLAEVATNNTEQAEIAQLGIEVCRQATARDSNSAPAQYYLGMNLGKLAQTKGLGALKLVRQMERVFTAARELDEKFDYAGPDRNLGLLYRDAPSIGSIGNRTKARQHLQSAVTLAPHYADNGLNLIEAYLKWGDLNSAMRELKALEALLPDARKKLSGPAWASAWNDWNSRLDKCRKKLQDAGKSLQSPRHS